MKILWIWTLTILKNLVGVWMMKLSSSGGFTRITVRISDDIPQSKCDTLLHNLQILLRGCSGAVGVASGGEVRTQQFIIITPSTWVRESCRSLVTSNTVSGDTRYTGHDMLVVPGTVHAVHLPYTLQTGGCGAPGDMTLIPDQFIINLSNNTEQRYKILAHEFFKLRFGIFDERGYHGDPVYPDHYVDTDHKIQPTSAADSRDVLGEWRNIRTGAACNTSVDECLFHVDTDQHLSCSLSSFPSVSSVRSYCDQETLLAPTKHNNLCQNTSPQSVILNSPDFQFLQHIRHGNNQQQFKHPELIIIQERSPRYVLLLETSSAMLRNDDWKWINKALKKLIKYDLDDETEIGLVTFSYVGRVESGVGEQVRSHLFHLLPDKYQHQASTGDTCLLCGVNTALETLGQDKRGGHMIIITRADLATHGDTERRKLVEYAETYQISVSSVIVTDSATDVSLFTQLSSLTGGQTHLVTDSRSMLRYRHISSSLSRIVDSQEVTMMETVVNSSDTVSEGEVVIDEMSGKNVVFGILVNNPEDHFIKSVSFTDINSGATHGPFTVMSSVHDDINMKTVNFGLQQNSVLAAGVWRLRVEWISDPRHESHARHESVMLVTSRHDNTDPFTIRAWTSSRDSETSVTHLHPVSVHVSVMRGELPVLRAAVRVLISVADHELAPLTLLDNGSGDADLVQDDGVYSRYLTQYPRSGVYSVSVDVSDNDNQAVVASVQDYPAVVAETGCCGSTTRVNTGAAQRTGMFRRIISRAVSINIVEVPESRGDRTPPSRVADLRVKSSGSGSDELRLVFTSPGDDHDHGAVTEVLVFFNKNKQNLINSELNHDLLRSIDMKNTSAGDLIEKRIVVTSLDEDYYVAVVGVDEAGNRGRMSNIVHVLHHSWSNHHDHNRDIHTAATTIERINNNNNNSEWHLILALCSSFFFLALCLFAGVIYFLRCSSGSIKPTLVDVGVSDDVTDPDNVSHCSSEIRHMMLTTDYPLLLDPADLTPVHHDQRLRSPLGTLTPIKEEYLGHFTEFGDDDTGEYYEVRSGHTNTPGTLHQRNLAVMESFTDLTSESGHNAAEHDSDVQESDAGGERFSLGTQTVEPSCVATIRSSSDMVVKQRFASLV